MVKQIKKERNPAIELYRIMLMFGIVWLHCVCQGKYSGIWPRYLLGFCVPGFILITGYFGVRFSLKKTIVLYGTVLYACLLAPFMGGAFMHGNYWQEVLRVWDAKNGFWFVHAYVLLMVVAPLINPIFDGQRSKKDIIKLVTPVLCAIFGWGALLNYNHLKPLIPAPVGLEAASFFTFIGVYIIGRLIRVYGAFERLSIMTKIVLLLLLIVFISFTQGFFSSGNNPVCVCLAIMSFLVMKQLTLPSGWTKPLTFVSSFMFAIYCIHGTVYFPFTGIGPFAVIEWSKDVFIGLSCPLLLTILGSAVIAFFLALLLALPYRLIEIIFSRIIGKVCRK